MSSDQYKPLILCEHPDVVVYILLNPVYYCCSIVIFNIMSHSSDRTLKQEFSHALSIYALLFSNTSDTAVVIHTASLGSSAPSTQDLQTPNSEKYQALLNECIESFKACQLKSEQLALFSDNEIIDDVATESILFLTIDYYLATLNDKIYTADIAGRRPLAIKSKQLYLQFLNQSDSYELLNTESAKILHYITKAPVDTPTFTTAFASSHKNPADQRAAKIAKFKREKQVEDYVKDLRSQMLAKNDLQEDSDDDIARDLYLKQLELFIERSFNAIQGLDAELEILAFAASRPPPLPRVASPISSESKKDDYSDKVDLPGRNSQPLLTAQGRVNRPFMIVSKREQLKNNVFKPDYTLPTMTIDEYLEEERRQGNIIEGGGPDSAKKTEIDEDDDKAQDEETYRLRQWDEFTEANPRGSGNTMTNLG
ncbi:TAP42-like family-domain-containing protein [Kockiozyma suomiensis]|uniref:TAP42-like family-domain-containing protein n=1 Tax=Kockiozyma suomiensis TaxID=1337062 RepID=UPI00334373FB